MAYDRVRYTAPKAAPHFDEFEAGNDIEAVRIATRMVRAHPAELWCGDRMVIAFEAS